MWSSSSFRWLLFYDIESRNRRNIQQEDKKSNGEELPGTSQSEDSNEEEPDNEEEQAEVAEQFE